jgi:hypothetical protein
MHSDHLTTRQKNRNLASSRIGSIAAAVALGVFAVYLVTGGWEIVLLLAAALSLSALIGYVGNSVIKGDCDGILVGWALLFPLGYYYLSYPRTAPIIQFDRTVVLLLVGCMLATPKERTWLIPRDMKRAAIAWGLLLVTTLISFSKMPRVLQDAPPVLTIGRLIVEAFLIPALLGWYVVRQFRLRPHAKWLHIAVCVISLYCCALGIADIILQHHVLTYNFSGYYWSYDPANPGEWAFLRPSGPFTTAGSFGLIGLVSFFLLGFLWKIVRKESGPWARALHVLGSGAAILQPLITLNRATYLTIVICAVISMFWSTGARRFLHLVGIGVIALLISVVAVAAPGVFKDRTSSDNIYGRVAENQQSWEIFSDYPITGVGLMNFTPIAENTPRYQASHYQGVEGVNSPHNNIAWIAAEMGIVGLVPYLASQILLVVAFRKLRKYGEPGETAWRYFVFVFLGYWLPGLTWSNAQSGDLNIWFMFTLCLLYRYGVGEQREGAARSTHHYLAPQKLLPVPNGY